MSVQPTLFSEIFALWPHDAQLADDMAVPRGRARQWVNRDYIAPWYWPRLVDVLEQKFGRVVTYRQLVEAAAALRGQTKIAAQTKAVDTRRRNKLAECSPNMQQQDTEAA